MIGPPPDIDFEDEIVEPALNTLDAERDDLELAWRNSLRAVHDGEAGFGVGLPDTLNRAFFPGYVPRADATRREADHRVDRFGALIAAGVLCISIYRKGDGDAALPFLAQY